MLDPETKRIMNQVRETGEPGWLAACLKSTIPERIPDRMPEVEYDHRDRNWMPQMLYNTSIHTIVNWLRMWCLVDLKWTHQLVDMMNLTWAAPKNYLEVMAGAGWLAKAMRYAIPKDGKYIAVDNFTKDYGVRDEHLVTDVINMDALEAIEKYGRTSDVLVISWAPYNDPIGHDCLEAWLAQNKELGKDRYVIVVGEWNGCTGTRDMEDHLKCLEYLNIPTWKGVHDDCSICRVIEADHITMDQEDEDQ